MRDVDHLRSTLDHLLEGFQLLDEDLRYVYVNPAAAAQGRSTPEALVGRTMAEAYPGIETSPLYERLRACLREREPFTFENHFVFPDGSARWFELRLEPVPQGVCVHSVDIDDRKAAEEALRLANEELEQRVRARTLELERAYAELEAFSYSVSHDLRAPLRGIDGFAQALAEDYGSELDETASAYLARIRASAHRMGLLIDELLELARVTRATVEPVMVDLSTLAERVRAELEEREPSRSVTWAIEPGLMTSCDPGLARIVLDNLLGNAWKFTSKTASPRIALRRGAQQGAFVIEDNGAGFDMKYATKLFTPFQRLHRAQEFPGTGIGLATVQRIVHKHGGSLEAHGEVDVGASVSFRFEAPTT